MLKGRNLRSFLKFETHTVMLKIPRHKTLFIHRWCLSLYEEFYDENHNVISVDKL